MNDKLLKLASKARDELTIEDAIYLSNHGICVVCEDGGPAYFEACYYDRHLKECV